MADGTTTKPLLITRPPEGVSDMTDEVRQAYARELVDAFRTRMTR